MKNKKKWILWIAIVFGNVNVSNITGTPVDVKPEIWVLALLQALIFPLIRKRTLDVAVPRPHHLCFCFVICFCWDWSLCLEQPGGCCCVSGAESSALGRNKWGWTGNVAQKEHEEPCFVQYLALCGCLKNNGTFHLKHTWLFLNKIFYFFNLLFIEPNLFFEIWRNKQSLNSLDYR